MKLKLLKEKKENKEILRRKGSICPMSNSLERSSLSLSISLSSCSEIERGSVSGSRVVHFWNKTLSPSIRKRVPPTAGSAYASGMQVALLRPRHLLQSVRAKVTFVRASRYSSRVNPSPVWMITRRPFWLSVSNSRWEEALLRLFRSNYVLLCYVYTTHCAFFILLKITFVSVRRFYIFRVWICAVWNFPWIHVA